MVSIDQTYRYFSLDTEDRFFSLISLLGQMSIFGIHTSMSCQNEERALRVMDAVNCLLKADFFIALSCVKIQLHAFKHVVGQHTSNR
jgi:hypothetical protein